MHFTHSMNEERAVQKIFKRDPRHEDQDQVNTNHHDMKVEGHGILRCESLYPYSTETLNSGAYSDNMASVAEEDHPRCVMYVLNAAEN
jgi:hypothetical protein